MEKRRIKSRTRMCVLWNDYHQCPLSSGSLCLYLSDCFHLLGATLWNASANKHEDSRDFSISGHWTRMAKRVTDERGINKTRVDIFVYKVVAIDRIRVSKTITRVFSSTRFVDSLENANIFSRSFDFIFLVEDSYPFAADLSIFFTCSTI